MEIVQYFMRTLQSSTIVNPKANLYYHLKPILLSSGDCPRHLFTEDSAPFFHSIFVVLLNKEGNIVEE